MGIDWNKINTQKAKLEERSNRSSGTGAKWWRPVSGDNRVRVMPGWDATGPFQGQFWREVAQHWQLNDEQKGPILCPKKTPHMSGPCPVCDFIEELKKDTSDLRAQEIAKDCRAKTAYMMNIVDATDPVYTAKDVAEFKKSYPDRDCPFASGDAKVQVYAAPVSVFNQILGVMTTNNRDITDAQKGHDVNIKKTGKGFNTRYETSIIIDSTEAPEGDLNALDQLGFEMDFTNMVDLLSAGVGGTYVKLLPSGTDSAAAVVAPSEEDLGGTASVAELQAQLKNALGG